MFTGRHKQENDSRHPICRLRLQLEGNKAFLRSERQSDSQPRTYNPGHDRQLLNVRPLSLLDLLSSVRTALTYQTFLDKPGVTPNSPSSKKRFIPSISSAVWPPWAKAWISAWFSSCRYGMIITPTCYGWTAAIPRTLIRRNRESLGVAVILGVECRRMWRARVRMRRSSFRTLSLGLLGLRLLSQRALRFTCNSDVCAHIRGCYR
jgi:hypothetical protein